MKRVGDAYMGRLRKAAAKDGPVYHWTIRREHALILLAAGLLVVAGVLTGKDTPVGIGFFILAALVALLGTAAVLFTFLKYTARAGDKRYNMFTRKTLSREYQEDDA